jgi:hypothetical protein
LAVVARREYQLSCRGLAFWLLAAGGCALAVWRASAPGTSAPLAAYQALQVILVGVGVIAILVAGSAAARDRRQGTEELILSKPAGTAPALVAVRFAAVWAAMATVGAIVLAAAAIGQAALARTAWQPLAYADALARSLLPIGLATALGFSLASLFVTPLAAAVAAIYWVATPLTRAHMPMVLDWSLAQHWTLPALLVPALVALAASLHARAVRSHRRAAARAGWMAGVLLAGAALAVFLVARGGEDALVRPDPVLLAIAGQTTVEGDRAPGFWLPDAEERLVGMVRRGGAGVYRGVHR